MTVADGENIGNTAGVSINTSGVQQGSLTITGDTTISGTVGQAGANNNINNLNVNGGAGKIVNAQADVFTDVTTINGAGAA